MFQGYKTIAGAILVGVSTAIRNLEESGVLPVGTLEALTGMGQGIGALLVIYGIGDKIERKLGS